MSSSFFKNLIFLFLLIAGCRDQGNKEKPIVIAPEPGLIQDEPLTKTSAKNKTIVFLGNSLTAGYGVMPTESFPSLIQAKIDSLHLPYKVVNAGISGETSADGFGRIDWVLRQPIDILILELGGNDGLRGIPMSETEKNLQSIIHTVSQKFPNCKIVLAGMEIPPNMGKTYTSEFRVVFRKLAKLNKTFLIPFLLAGVGGVQELNQPDGIHPNAEGHKLVADNVWTILKPLMTSR